MPNTVVKNRRESGLLSEWSEVAQLVSPGYYWDSSKVVNGLVADPRIQIFCCPDLGYPQYLSGASGEGDTFSLNYNYVGCASEWQDFDGVTDPALSPFKPDDSPNWTLMADYVYYNAPPSQGPIGWTKPEVIAHKNANGQPPKGANHLFNDGSVHWYDWKGGSTMRTNTIWADGNYWIWRRSSETP
jgi:hypothetical protein